MYEKKKRQNKISLQVYTKFNHVIIKRKMHDKHAYNIVVVAPKVNMSTPLSARLLPLCSLAIEARVACSVA